jgi:hypothetical protein
MAVDLGRVLTGKRARSGKKDHHGIVDVLARMGIANSGDPQLPSLPNTTPI